MDKPHKISSKIDDELKAVLDPSDKLESLISYLSQNRQTIILVLLGLLIATLGIWRITQRSSMQLQEFNTLKASWLNEPITRPSLLDPMGKLLHQHPEWMGSWKGTFLQTSLDLHRLDLVDAWQNLPGKRLFSDDSNLRKILDEASLISYTMGQKDWKKAIESADQWLKSYTKDPVVLGESMVRLCELQVLTQRAMCYSELQDASGEYVAWTDLIKNLRLDLESFIKSEIPQHSMQPLEQSWLQSFGSGQLTLLDYVRERLKILQAHKG